MLSNSIRDLSLSLTSDSLWKQTWDVDQLENVPICPICEGAERKLLHNCLVDNVFFSAPGSWTLYRCVDCGGAYLDPRPTPLFIHRAYANYYTHQQSTANVDYATLSPFRKLRRRLVNGYTNWRYSTNAYPANIFGVLASYAMPSLKRMMDRQYRHLPRLPQSGGRLLDVGCGDGSFLKLADSSGWDVVGLDPDPMAIANAAQYGLTVHQGGIEYFAGQANIFDVITLSHVIEHVHEPVKFLEVCYGLLKPGGQLWLETPNIDSIGHARFQKNWRGLETPRHLVIFDCDSLAHAFIRAGFSAPQNVTCPSPCSGMFRVSFAMELGHYPNKAPTMPLTLQFLSSIAALWARVFPSRREFLTVIARKVKD